VDSDDWIEPDMYASLYSLMLSANGQIACCGVQKDSPEGIVGYFNPFYPAETQVKEFNTLEALGESLINARITYSPCDKLYRKEIWQGLRMSEGKIYEDMEILPKCVERAERIVYDPRPLYHYSQTESSTIRGHFSIRRFTEADVSRERIPYFEEKYPSLALAVKAYHVDVCLNIIYRSTHSPECKEKRRELIREMRKEVSSKTFSALNSKSKLKYLIFRISVPLFVKFMSFYYRTKD
jgi:hypothetical protein